MTVYQKIIQHLQESNATFEVSQHAPTHTSEASAAARGEALEIGAKALVMKVDNAFYLFVMSAARKADSKAIKAFFNAKKIRFASPQELYDQTGLVPGSVPPFGEPILPYRLYIDSSIVALPLVAFNAGSLTDSVKLKTEDYLQFSNGKIISFTQLPE